MTSRRRTTARSGVTAARPGLTPRQLEILTFIRDYQHRHGYSPTMQEIADTLGITKVTVFEHVGGLEGKGLLRRAPHKARSLQISSRFIFPDQGPAHLPLWGRIAAGCPIEAIADQQTVDLEEFFAAAGETFVLKVCGDSMSGDHIADGDFVVIERRDFARDGDIVVALLDSGEATLKRLFRERHRVRLQPSNPDHEPIYAKDVNIQGVLAGVLRRC